MIAVIRQIIIFKSDEFDSTTGAVMTAGVFFILLLGLLVGFYLVHQQDEAELE